jgi:hypothetical protein
MVKQTWDWLWSQNRKYGLLWELAVGLLVAIVLVVWGSLRNALADAVSALLRYLGDLLASDVEVWLLLLALLAQGGALVIFVVWWTTRRQSSRSVPTATTADKPSIWSLCPYEIDHFDVLWPITTEHDGFKPTRFKVGKPMCPQDRNPLGWFVLDDMLKPLDERSWEKLNANDLRLGCFKDGSKYDLMKFNLHMGEAITVVEGRAWGEYRDALKKAGLSY